jgi:fructose-1,6-bisphosphatase/inositol monophosphatase family enzyme
MAHGGLPDPEAVARLLADVAAEEIMPRFQRLAAHEVREKAAGELVTVVDEAVERRLEAALRDMVPGALVLGEEAAAADPKVLDHLLGEDAVWIIDPIDGTGNFAEGRPIFAVMVAFVRHGEVLAGWICDPVAARTAVAVRGAGAWEEGERLRVAAPPAAPAELTGSLLAGFFGNRRLGQQIQARRDRVRAVRSVRCVGHHYLRLARGQMHFMLSTRLMPWDHAPGVLLHAEAGGHSAYFEGGAFNPARIDASGILLAPDRPSWEALQRLLLEPE